VLWPVGGSPLVLAEVNSSRWGVKCVVAASTRGRTACCIVSVPSNLDDGSRPSAGIPKFWMYKLLSLKNEY
jgi:hypothetical protein